MLKRRNVVITGGFGGIAQAMQTYIINNSYLFNVYAPADYVLDVTDEQKIKKYFEEVTPHVLINCAAYIKVSSVIDMTLIEWEKQIKVNLTGAFLCSKYALLAGCEKIINVGSTSCFEGRKEWAGYGASKVGLLSLTESLIAEGIDSQIICFGRTYTPLRQRLFPNETKNDSMNAIRVAETILEMINGVYGNAKIIFCEPASSYILNK